MEVDEAMQAAHSVEAVDDHLGLDDFAARSEGKPLEWKIAALQEEIRLAKAPIPSDDSKAAARAALAEEAARLRAKLARLAAAEASNKGSDKEKVLS